jgi:DNA-binding response OmpR family regulator
MSSPIKILLAEDEPSLGQIIRESLETRGYRIFHCVDGNQAIETYLKEKPDILVLDVMMPKKDGFSVAREIRMQDLVIPIIFLTAKSQTRDVIEGFSLGGNDYLKKPFSMEELIVRIENLLRTSKKLTEKDPVLIGDYIFDLRKQSLKYKDEEAITLTHREAHLLFHLCLNKNRVLDRSFILKKLWGNDDFFNARSMDVFISKLRKKLEKDENIKIINVRGYGYKLMC